MMRFWRWLRGDPEAVERARKASVYAGVQWARAQESERDAVSLLLENHLTRRFFHEMKRRGAL